MNNALPYLALFLNIYHFLTEIFPPCNYKAPSELERGKSTYNPEEKKNTQGIYRDQFTLLGFRVA